MNKYRIVWVSWNAAHPQSTILGYMYARSPKEALKYVYKKWPCGNGQVYEAMDARR
jgi:hypothetical protein